MIFSAPHTKILIRSFNMLPENKKLSDFCDLEAYLFITLYNSVLLTNNKQSFMRSDVYETSISDHHNKMIISVLRKTFVKANQKLSFIVSADLTT